MVGKSGQQDEATHVQWTVNNGADVIETLRRDIGETSCVTRDRRTVGRGGTTVSDSYLSAVF